MKALRHGKRHNGVINGFSSGSSGFCNLELVGRFKKLAAILRCGTLSGFLAGHRVLHLRAKHGNLSLQRTLVPCCVQQGSMQQMMFCSSGVLEPSQQHGAQAATEQPSNSRTCTRVQRNDGTPIGDNIG